jgi:hypothetical protein
MTYLNDLGRIFLCPITAVLGRDSCPCAGLFKCYVGDPEPCGELNRAARTHSELFVFGRLEVGRLFEDTSV